MFMLHNIGIPLSCNHIAISCLSISTAYINNSYKNVILEQLDKLNTLRLYFEFHSD